MSYHERKRPRTVTRGLAYRIGPDYLRLRRLVREYEQMQRCAGPTSFLMVRAQCETLHFKVFKAKFLT